MATKVYTPTTQPPNPTDQNWMVAEQRYKEAVRAEIAELAGGTGDYSGKEIRFPVADGYASYLIISLSPPRVMWLEVGDCWEFQYITSLNKRDLQDNADRLEAIITRRGKIPWMTGPDNSATAAAQ